MGVSTPPRTEPATSRFTFSSSELPAGLTPAQRAAVWIEAASNATVGLDADCPERDSFSGFCDTLRFGQFVITVAEANAVITQRRRKHIARDQADSVMMLAHLSGGAVLGEQFGREVIVGENVASFFDAAESQTTQTRNHGRVLGLYIPRPVLSDGGIDIAALAATPVSVAHNNAMRMLTGYLGFLLDTTESASETIVQAASGHISDLLLLALGGEVERLHSNRGVRAARVASLKSLIKRRSHVPDFSILDAARLLRVTPRYIQKLLHQEGTTFTELLNSCRLAAAARTLADDRCLWTVSEIAYRCGFGDLSNFYRAFQAQFGTSPGRFRRDD